MVTRRKKSARSGGTQSPASPAAARVPPTATPPPRRLVMRANAQNGGKGGEPLHRPEVKVVRGGRDRETQL